MSNFMVFKSSVVKTITLCNKTEEAMSRPTHEYNGSDGQIQTMIWFKSWLNHVVISFEEQWVDLENVWFDLDLILNFTIWFEIIPNHKNIFHAM